MIVGSLIAGQCRHLSFQFVAQIVTYQRYPIHGNPVADNHNLQKSQISWFSSDLGGLKNIYKQTNQEMKKIQVYDVLLNYAI